MHQFLIPTRLAPVSADGLPSNLSCSTHLRNSLKVTDTGLRPASTPHLCISLVGIQLAHALVDQSNTRPRFYSSTKLHVHRVKVPTATAVIQSQLFPPFLLPNKPNATPLLPCYRLSCSLLHCSGVKHLGVHACIALISSLSAVLTNRCRASAVFFSNCGETIIAWKAWPHPPV